MRKIKIVLMFGIFYATGCAYQKRLNIQEQHIYQLQKKVYDLEKNIMILQEDLDNLKDLFMDETTDSCCAHNVKLNDICVEGC
jgi:predicted RNase H-like nuclease (RuvC/YqgF family)